MKIRISAKNYETKINDTFVLKNISGLSMK